MEPIKTPNSNFVYRGPSDGIMDLHCQRVRPGEMGNNPCSIVFSVWELSPRERQMIANGANIRLGVWGMEPIPPMSVDVVGEQRLDGN